MSNKNFGRKIEKFSNLYLKYEDYEAENRNKELIALIQRNYIKAHSDLRIYCKKQNLSEEAFISMFCNEELIKKAELDTKAEIISGLLKKKKEIPSWLENVDYLKNRFLLEEFTTLSSKASVQALANGGPEQQFILKTAFFSFVQVRLKISLHVATLIGQCILRYEFPSMRNQRIKKIK